MKVKALQCYAKNKIEIVEFDKPEPEDDSIILKIKYCGICGTDLHGIEGRRPVNFPFIPGHEIVATVDSIGKDACSFIKVIEGNNLQVGDRVTINPRIVCGHCYYCNNLPMFQEMCINAITATSIGSKNFPYLSGGWAEYFYVQPGSEIIKLPEKLSDGNATLIEPYSVAVGCVERYKVIHDWISGDSFEINDPVVIYGAGAIGLLMVAGFHLAGAKDIIAIDIRNNRLDLAKEFGASFIINASETKSDERVKIIRRITRNIGAGVVVEACGIPEIINEGVSALRRGGILFEIGHLFNIGKAKIDPFIICRNEIKILGHYAYPSSQTMLYAAKILEKNTLPYNKLLKFFRLDQYKEVIFGKKTDNGIKPIFLISG